MKALVLKTSEVQASVGSNPTLSAISEKNSRNTCFFFENRLYLAGKLFGAVLKLAEEDGLLNR